MPTNTRNCQTVQAWIRLSQFQCAKRLHVFDQSSQVMCLDQFDIRFLCLDYAGVLQVILSESCSLGWFLSLSFLQFHQCWLVRFLCGVRAEHIEGALGHASLIAGSSTPSLSQARNLATVPKLKQCQFNTEVAWCKLWQNKFYRF